MSRTEVLSRGLAVPTLGLLLLAGLLGCGAEEVGDPFPAPEVPEGHRTIEVQGVGFETPGSIIHDSLADVYLVSNVNGGPLVRDGNGFISRVRPEGKVDNLRWIEGDPPEVLLDGPKGMAIRGDTIFVADIDCIRLFHRATGHFEGSLCPPGATNLIGVTVDEDGILYVTDSGLGEVDGASGGGAIYAIEVDGSVSVLLSGEELGQPRGIAASKRGIFFTSFGEGSLSQITPGGPLLVLRGKGWQLDGLFFAPNGSFAFSNWSDSTVLIVQAKYGGARGELFTLVRGVPFAGGIGYDSRRSWALIPMLHLNRLFFLEVWPQEGD